MPFSPSDFPSIHAKVVFVSNCGAAGDFTLQGNGQGTWSGSLGAVSVELFLMDGPQMFMSAWYNGQYLITRPGTGLGIPYIFGAFGLDTAQCPPAGGSFYVEVDFDKVPDTSVPTCGCSCDCGCKGGQAGGGAGGGGAASQNLVPLLASAATPTEFSAAPIRYATGEIHLDATDLVGGGFGAAWGHTRSYASRMYVDADVGQGFDWQVAEWPYLVAQTDPDGHLTTLVLMGHAGKAVWFDVAGDNFVARFGVQLTLAHDAANHVYRLTDPSGNVTLFDDSTLLFKQRSDAAGNQINVVSYIGTANLGEVQRSYSDGNGDATVESFLYSYAAGGDGVNRLGSVLLRRQVNGGAWQNVRQAVYTYWDGSNAFGSLGDLKTAQVQSWENGAWNSLGTTLYRYWVAPASSRSSSSSAVSSSSSASSSSSGPSGPAVFNHALKYVVQPDSYARLAADPNSGSDPTVAADAVLAQYADNYFEYDWSRRVTLESVEGGARAYSYAYQQSGFAPGINAWMFKTTETLPGGTQNVIYSNYAGQVMLSVKIPVAGQGNGPWYDFYAYDTSFRVALHAESSAITGYSESFSDLLHCVQPSSSSSSSSHSSTPSSSSHQSFSSMGSGGGSSSSQSFGPGLGNPPGSGFSLSPPSTSSSSSYSSGCPCGCQPMITCTGNYQYMADYAGLVHLYDYDPASGYAIRERIRNGECGCDNKLWERVYQAFTAQANSSSSSSSSSSSGGTAAPAVYLVTQETQFRDDITGDPQQSYRITTSYAYTLLPGTAQVQSRTTSWPVVAISQNGSGVADSRVDWFDQYGNLTWSKDERGFIQYRAYDIPTGGLVQSIEDVNTALMTGVPAGWSTPSGGGLHLVSDYTVDSLGRTTQVLGPSHQVDIGGVSTTVRRASWTVYLDSQFTAYSGQGYATQNSSSSSLSSSSGSPIQPNYTYTLVNPVSVTITDAVGKVTDQISAIRASTAGALSSSDTFPQSSYCRWTTNQYTDCCKLASTRVYFAIPSLGSGTPGVNYNETDFGYDFLNRRNRVVSPGGTITRTIFDARDLPTAIWVGTDDTGATDSDPTGGGAPGNNMVVVTEYQYDSGLAGEDGNRTQETQHVDSSTTRVTTFSFDWRDREVQITAAQDWYQVTTLDNLSRATRIDRHAQATGNLIGRSKTLYDDRSRVYQTITYGVDPSTGTVGNPLVDNTWYDPSGHTIKSLPSGSNAFTKLVYDGAGRQTVQYFGYDLGSSESNYASASDVTDDTIVEQTETAYDAASNVIQTTFRQRFHNATGVGALTYPGSAQPVARVAYAAMYPDAVGREQATANYGTNGDATLVRSATIPARADTVLVDSTLFNSRGEAYQSIDPAGTVTQTVFDDAGRRTELIQNYIVASSSSSSSSSSSGALPTSDDKNITTIWTYSPDGQIATLTAVNSATGNQVTTYGYGTSLPSSDIARSDILSSVTYPDGGIVTYLANRQGQTKQFTDQRLVVHAYDFDLLGRQTQDRVISLGSSSSSSSRSSSSGVPSGVDGTVQRIGRTYEVRGMLQNVTSYSSPIVGQGSVVNDVQRVYNSFGQLITEYQEHSGAVNTSTSVNVQYQYADGSSNTIRQTALIYPNGRVLIYGYGTAGGIDDALSRVASLIDNDGVTHLVDYTRLGSSTFVQQSSPQPQLAWSLINGSGTDPYTGLDQFGRVVDNRWYSTASSSSSSSSASSSGSSSMDLDRIQHGYDRAGNRLWRKNPVAKAAGVYLDELYSYDGIYRLSQLQRGELNGSNNGIIPGTLSYAQAWGLDATCNWNQFWESDRGTSWSLQQSRIASRFNEITDIRGGNWVQPVYDAAGNIVTMPVPSSPTADYSATYDAWNRPIVLSSDGSVVARSAYDGARRRLSTVASGVKRHFYYSAPWYTIEERLGTSMSAERQFVWGFRHVDDLVLRDRNTERFYCAQDANSNATAIYTSLGQPQERYAFSAYGEPVFFNADFTTVPDSLYDWETLYAGYRRDAASALYVVRTRSLDPTIGNWLTRDLLLSRGGPNYYAYVLCNPLTDIDPVGMQGKCTVGLYDSQYTPGPLDTVPILL